MVEAGGRLVWVEEPLVKVSDLADVELGLSSRSRFGGRPSGGPITGDSTRNAEAMAVQVSCFVFMR